MGETSDARSMGEGRQNPTKRNQAATELRSSVRVSSGDDSGSGHTPRAYSPDHLPGGEIRNSAISRPTSSSNVLKITKKPIHGAPNAGVCLFGSMDAAGIRSQRHSPGVVASKPLLYSSIPVSDRHESGVRTQKHTCPFGEERFARYCTLTVEFSTTRNSPRPHC